MKLTNTYARLFRYLLPSPLSIALVLTFITFIIAYSFGEIPSANKLKAISTYWYNGLWSNNLMVFAMQMMLMLVLGHCIALTPVVDRIITSLLKNIRTNASAAYWVCLLSLIVSLFNWGLGLIFGAVFALRVKKHADQINLKLNYPLIGAAGYSGLMVWHGGISGSSLIKVAEKDHLKNLVSETLSPEKLAQLPEQLSLNETVFSFFNLAISLVLLIALPLLMYFLGKNPHFSYSSHQKIKTSESSRVDLIGAEKLDHSNWLGKLIGLIILIVIGLSATAENNNSFIGFITPNFINSCLLGLCFLFHRSIIHFLSNLDEAIKGAAGILIQFPLYFGIMGIMKSSGLVSAFADFISSAATPTTLPIFIFFSAAIVNIFVPSGGGQWAIQGPILIESALNLGVPLYKNILAMAYGDQLTNMLQPFWALPLLGITGLKAKELLPYTLLLMFGGTIIFVLALLFF